MADAAIARNGLPLPWLRRLAGLAIAFENLWPALWPALCILLIFAVAAAFNVVVLLPPLLHRLALAMFGLALAAAIVHAFRQFRTPGSAAGIRRLERDSRLAHRPLLALGDRKATAEGAGDALWQAHLARSRAAATRIRLAWPRGGLAGRDPYAIRVGLALLLGVGAISAGSDLWPRVIRAVTPESDATGIVSASAYDLWITPPEYTGLPPIYRNSASAAPGTAALDVPTGSTLMVRVHGGEHAPALSVNAAESDFQTVGTTEYAVSAPIKETGDIAAEQNHETLFRLPVRIIPDLPPAAAWRGPAQVMPRAALRLDYTATDDYGVTALALSVAPADGHAPAETVDIALPSHGKEVKQSAYEDLAASPWAGTPVEMKLIAKDAIGQTGISAPLKLTLPEREFHHPVARAIIDQRKLLMRDPAQADIAAETLEDLASRPDRFRNDTAVFLALRSAADRLALDKTHAHPEAVYQLLWDAALRIEDGDMPQAQNSLRQAEQALQQALDRNASDAEIEALMKQLQQAINRYLQAMMADAQRNGAQPPQPGSQGTPTISPSDINKMLNDARNMAQTGARDAAKQALANLQNLLESLRTPPADSSGQTADGKALDAMRDLARRQQQLLDKSYRAGEQNGQPGDQRPGDQKSGDQKSGHGSTPEDLAGAQEGLRRQLGEVGRQMGENGQIPQSLSRADRAMNEATTALKQGNSERATGQQGEALDQIQQAIQELGEKMGQNGPGSQAGGKGRDPFGRSAEGQVDGGDVKLPTGADLQQSRQILDELRRRAADWQRPAIERDYLNRLLERF